VKATEIPSLDVVRRVVRCLEGGGLDVAIGGSGLLAALGLMDVVHDWDVTTDGPASVVELALERTGFPYREAAVGEGNFATEARYIVDGQSHQVDVLVGFALRDGDRTIVLPTRVSGRWRGLPLADPAVWELAYRLLGNGFKADLLSRWNEDADSSA
jgi:hypothetical protein